MAARPTFCAENLTRDTSTPTSWDGFVTLGFQPEANKTYVGLWMVVVDATSNGTDIDVRLRDTVAGADIAAAQIRPTISSASAKLPQSGTFRLTFGESPPAQQLQIQWQRAAGTGTVGIDKGAILLWEAVADDNFVENTGTTNATSAYVTAATLNFTAPAGGDVLLLFGGEFQNAASAAAGPDWKIDNGSVIWRCSECNVNSTSGWGAWAGMARLTGLEGEQSITLQLQGSAGTSVNVRNARIWAIDVAGFEAFQYNESIARSPYNTDTTDQTKATVTFTPAAVEHIVIGTALLDSNSSSTANQSVIALKEDGSDVYRIEKDPRASAAELMPFLLFYRKTLAAEETDFDLDYATENTANTVGISEARVAVLQTGAGGGGGDPDPEPSALLSILRHMAG
jgi:hypothetical protein